jgi:hypothetical protein
MTNYLPPAAAAAVSQSRRPHINIFVRGVVLSGWITRDAQGRYWADPTIQYRTKPQGQPNAPAQFFPSIPLRLILDGSLQEAIRQYIAVAKSHLDHCQRTGTIPSPDQTNPLRQQPVPQQPPMAQQAYAQPQAYAPQAPFVPDPVTY